MKSLIARASLLTLPRESINDAFVAVTIDTEQDVDREYRHTGTYKNIDEGVPQLLEVFDKFSAKATWLVTPDVAINKTDIIRELTKKDHEVGCHIHPEFFTQKCLRRTRPQMLMSDYSYEKQYLMINEATNTIEKYVGITPTSFRGGRFGINSDTVRSLEENRYSVDTSVTPYVNWRSGPDWSRYRCTSFFMSNAILEIPVSIVNSFGVCFWLRPSISDAAMLRFIMRKTAASSGSPVLNLMFHSMETVDPNPYVNPKIFFNRLEEFLNAVSSENLKWSTLKTLRYDSKVVGNEGRSFA
jgi:hypothetical protein